MTKVLSLGKSLVTTQANYYQKKDTTQFPVSLTVTPITLEGSIIGTIEVFHDITRERELDRMKDEFISIASHELRTPMTAVNGLLSMVLAGDYGPVNEGLRKPLDNISISAKRQIHLINDLLDVSRLQTGRIAFTLVPFSITTIIDEVMKSLQPLAQQKGITMQVGDLQALSAQGDIQWSKQILNNLVGNALKFTDTGSITISATLSHAMVQIAITDTGIGIEASDYEKLFGKFQQLHADTTHRPAGSGLGLYLSRELARKMGGDIILAKSKLGGGSPFLFSLPHTGEKPAEKIKTEQTSEIEIANAQKND
jgi:signal transduction histidine kinase